MIKKFSLLASAMAILAFAVPALANASTGLTEEVSPGTFVLISPPANITATSTNSFVESSSLGKLTCEKVILNAEVTKNNEKEGVEGKGVGEGTSSGCKRNGTVAITVNKIKLTNITSTAAEVEKGKASFSFTANLPELTCNYTATNALGTYVKNTASLKLSKAALTVSPAACGTSTFSGDFELHTTSVPSQKIFIM